VQSLKASVATLLGTTLQRQLPSQSNITVITKTTCKHSACGWIFYFANIVILFAMIIMLFAVEKGILAWYNNDEMCVKT
jgi:hypothetical protein